MIEIYLVQGGSRFKRKILQDKMNYQNNKLLFFIIDYFEEGYLI